MTDIGSIDPIAACNIGTEIELVHPASRAPLGVFWRILGYDSDAYREYTREKINDNLRRASNQKKRGRESTGLTVEESEIIANEVLVVCSAGWRTGKEDVLKFNGEDLKFSPMNALKVFKERPWVRKQVDEAVMDIENFMKS